VRPHVVLALVAALSVPSAGFAESPEEAGAALRNSSKLEDHERAAALFEEICARKPENFGAQLGAAVALTQVMAIRTNANLPLVDGLQDSDQNRALWADLGKRALDHARAAEKLDPKSPEAAAALASSYMFYASSLGIIQSILSGTGGEYKAHANRLIELDANFDDALGSSLLASFYLVAPWPIHDRDAALAHFERAEKLAPASVRNQYGLAVFWARDGDAGRARTHFEHVISMPCTASTERLFCDFMKETARRELARLAAQ
jgi:tetratricopeptide (TPR) repeat protein